MKKVTLTIEADLANDEQHSHAGMLLALWAHEFKYQVEKRFPGNAVETKVEGYTLEL